MIISQCDALISLVDAEYHERAWCSVEVMMVQALRKAYKLHAWYEHVESIDAGPNKTYHLRSGPEDLIIDLDQKRLRFQSDRSRIMFLERQCKLLC